MELHVALSLRLDAIEAYRLAHAYRAEVITAVAEEAERRLQVGASRTVRKDAVLRFLRLEASVARAAATEEKSSRTTADATPEAYDGELAMLRGLVRTLRVVVRPDDADVNEVRRLLHQHVADETAARQEVRRG
ncbi:hypothetical protein B1H29_31915 [Streptomyces pactum]|uniref:Uncharacterized protein n=2 Tax=Streptomyces pactum TaxID=68249 RepID=A0A1S6JGK3_9ACTN|nr:hypothetical protein B1H29_31915 [Streptomyces pactum]